MGERIIQAGAADATEQVMQRHMPGNKYILVCDDATWVAAGQPIHSHLLSTYDFIPHSLGRAPKPMLAHAQKLIEVAKDRDGLVAVGSGTVNDVTKYAAHQLGKPYISVATAASMNGYTSATASLEENDFKNSLPATPPRAVVADLNIIANAPKRLARAGLGDMLCRSTVEADRLLSHHLLGTPYEREEFDMLRAHEQVLVPDTPKLVSADHDYMQRLMLALLDAGDAMARTGSSAVASQSEHLIAHTVETMYGSEVTHVLHGELVAITACCMAALQQKTLLSPTLQVKPLPHGETKFIRVFGKKAGPRLAKIYAKKVLSQEQCDAINARMQSEWPALKQALSAIMINTATLERAMILANIHTNIKKIGIDEHRFQSAVTYAHLTRDRFTFLDLNAMMGRSRH